jgi:hypothetical protein
VENKRSVRAREEVRRVTGDRDDAAPIGYGRKPRRRMTLEQRVERAVKLGVTEVHFILDRHELVHMHELLGGRPVEAAMEQHEANIRRTAYMRGAFGAIDEYAALIAKNVVHRRIVRDTAQRIRDVVDVVLERKAAVDVEQARADPLGYVGPPTLPTSASMPQKVRTRRIATVRMKTRTAKRRRGRYGSDAYENDRKR